MPYTDSYTVPFDDYGTHTIRTLRLALTVWWMVQIYVLLTVKRRLLQPCIQLYGTLSFKPNLSPKNRNTDIPQVVEFQSH
jgi:hypothetical protein